MASGRVKVIGYAQRHYYNQGIEYRNFTDDLVGAQQADSTSALPYSFSNIFDTEINNEGRLTKKFVSNKFSQFITLNDIDLSELNLMELIGNDNQLYLNADKTILTNYAYFGSLREFIRVSLENIILTWPASIYVKNKSEYGVSATTIENYYYDYFLDESTFKINVNRFNNPYGIDYLSSGDQLSGTTNYRSLTVAYMNTGITTGDYNISASTGEFNIIDFTAATQSTNDYVYIKAEGDPFPTLSSTTSGSFNYHIKPNQIIIEAFYNNLNNFESYLLNRYSTPKNRALFNLKLVNDFGNFVYAPKSFIWPVSDGYNLDFQSQDYIIYVNDLIELADEMDETQTNILTRFLVPNSITEFDSIKSCDGSIIESDSQKITKTLKIYGREFDEIKKYADGISFAHTVSYDKKDNIPDGLIKTMTHALGWDLTNSIMSDDVLTSYIAPSDTLYSGYSHGISAFESEIEFWRRLIINTPWIWKSKGTRKAVEFLIKIIGTPEGLIDFNEYVYTTNNQMDMDIFNAINLQINNTTDISNIPISTDGYPSPLDDTADMYFQQYGSWYQETAGSASTLDKLIGNNPHIGPYDGGSSYMRQFDCLIPNFSPVSLVEETVSTATTNLFTNYNSGTFNGIFDYDAYASFSSAINNSVIESAARASCIPSSACTFSGDWSVNIYINDNLTYDGSSFYTGTTVGDFPSGNLVTGQILSGGTALGLTSANVGETISFAQTAGFGLCEPPDLVGSTLKVKICVDFTYDCSGTTGTCEYCYTVADTIFDEYGSSQDIYITAYDSNNSLASDCYEITTEGIVDPYPQAELTECGCDETGCDNALKICIKETVEEPSGITDCGFVGFRLDDDGYVAFTLANGKETKDVSAECCKALGFEPIYVEGIQYCMWGEVGTGPSSGPSSGSGSISGSSQGSSVFIGDIDCDSLVVYSINSDTGLVTFDYNGTQVTSVPNSDCCKNLGFNAVQSEGWFTCYDPNIKINRR